MKINTITIEDRHSSSRGMNALSFDRLGAVVALVGRNGSGKSRTLRLVEDFLLTQVSLSTFIDGEITPPLHVQDFLLQNPTPEKVSIIIKDTELSQQSQSEDHRKFHAEFRAKYMPMIKDLRRNPIVQDYLQIALPFAETVKASIPKYVKRIDHSELKQLQQVVSGAANSKNESPVSFEELVEKVTEEKNYHEFKSINKTALNYLSKLPHQLVDDLDDCYGDRSQFATRTSFKRFESLEKMIKNFLNKDLTWEKQTVNRLLTTDGVTRQSKGIWKIDGREFNYSELSDGEKTLFAYSLLFFLLDQNPNIRIKESIIIIDEPELNLHPESEIAVIAGIRNVIAENGQLWIATHSLSILSSLSYDEIFMVKHNSIVPPSKATPGKSFIELMGLEDHIERLSHFITNISNWAFLNFMTQCFNDPDVVKSARPNDPEIELFKKSLRENPNAKVLLDFGAGQGRILKELILDEGQQKGLEYYALEIEPKNVEELKKLRIQEVFQNHIELPLEKFDFVLLCNVLHEIPILEWERNLQAVVKSLKTNGFIIVIEDMRLPKGEKIGEAGFLILDLESLQKLFSLDEQPSQLLSAEERYKDRIQCALINKSKINSIDKQTIIASLETLRTNSLLKIKQMRERSHFTKENKLSFGRESALYSQLHINSILAIDKVMNS